jgi:nucleoside-diphosphate-sugar epimerase
LIFRPSIIIGDSCTGKTPIFQVIYIPLRLLYQGLLPCIPARPGTTVDLVPVDWVNDVMVHIMGRDEARGKVFHVTAGPSRAATLGELLELATTYFDAHAPLAPPRGTEFISQEEYERRRSHARGRERALMTQLDSLLPYTGIDRLFDSRNTDRMLEGSDIRFPMFRTYADHIFAYCLEARWGKKKP